MRKKVITLTLYSLFYLYSFGQVKTSGVVTSAVLQKIKAEVDKEAVKFKDSLIKEREMTDENIEYSVDTFKLQHIADKRIDVDYSIIGMNTTVDEMTKGYDKLMNKYYQMLMRTLDSEDKKVLINAQRAWLQFKTAEMKFIFVVLKDKYSGGGGIVSNISVSDYSNIVIKRTDDLFDYYNTNIALNK